MELKLHSQKKQDNKYGACGIVYSIPSPYIVEKGKVYELKEKKDSTIKSLVIQKPAFITAICEDIDTGLQKIELTIVDNNRKIIIPKSIAYNKNKLINYADKGLHVTSLNANYWVDFISNLEVLNEKIIPIKQTCNHLGWVDEKSFLPYVKGAYELDVDEVGQTWINCVKPKGNLIEWIKVVIKHSKNPIFRFVISASFATPLLKILNVRNVVIYNWHQSRGGKTAASYMGMSVWGNPEMLKSDFSATLVGTEGLSKLMCDFPILIDEKMVSKNKAKIEIMIYELAGGKSKLRGTTTGSVQANAMWRGITLTSGEEPLSNNKSQDGVRSRIIELYGKPFESEEEASKIYDFTKENYGLAGPYFINKLIENYSTDNYQWIKDKFDETKTTIKKKYNGLDFAKISSIALIAVADILFRKIFLNKSEESTFEMLDEIVPNIMESNSKDLVDYAYSYIGDWILANDGRFHRILFKEESITNDNVNELHVNTSDLVKTESYGVYDKGVFYIWPSKFEEVLQKAGYNSDKVMRGFKERNYIVTEDSNSYTTKVYYNGCDREFIGIKLESETTTTMQALKEQGKLENMEKSELIDLDLRKHKVFSI